MKCRIIKKTKQNERDDAEAKRQPLSRYRLSFLRELSGLFGISPGLAPKKVLVEMLLHKCAATEKQLQPKPIDVRSSARTISFV